MSQAITGASARRFFFATRGMLRALLAGCVLVLACGNATAAKSGAAATFSPWKGGATPPLVLKDAKGKEYDLAALKGKVVIVNFWATWCEPCREEMPSLEELQDRYKSRSLVVLTVNMEEAEARVKQFIDATLLQADGLTVLYDRFGLVAKQWKARLLPVTFIIGTDGRIRYSLLGSADWSAADVRAKIEPLLPR